MIIIKVFVSSAKSTKTADLKPPSRLAKQLIPPGGASLSAILVIKDIFYYQLKKYT
jgi:hypothetical protein